MLQSALPPRFITSPSSRTSHVRLTSPGSVHPLLGREKGDSGRGRALSEPNYTAYVSVNTFCCMLKDTCMHTVKNGSLS